MYKNSTKPTSEFGRLLRLFKIICPICQRKVEELWSFTNRQIQQASDSSPFCVKLH